MNVAQVIKAGRDQNAGKMALHCGSIHLGYDRLFDDVERVASHLAASGVAPGDVVAVDVARPVSHWLVLLALLRIGAVSVSLTSNSENEVAALPEISMVVSGPSDYRSFPAALRQIHIEKAWLDGPPPASDQLPDPAVAARSVGRICFTSGSAGRPKAILLDAALLTARLAGTAGRSNISADTVLWCGLGPDTAYGFTGTLATWLAGGTVVLASGGPGSFAELKRHGTSVLVASPAALGPLLQQAKESLATPLRAATIVAGGRLSVSLRDDVLEHLCRTAFVAYGASEAGGITHANAVGLDRHAGFVGAGFSDVAVEIVNENNVVLPHQTKGYLRVRSDSMVSGYINDPTATRESFRSGWFYSGDFAQLEKDGALTMLGRPANILNIGGVKVFAEDIEGRVRGQTDVRDACAVALVLKGADPVLALVVVAPAIKAAQLGADLRADMPKLPRFHVVTVPSIPRNTMGKLNRDAFAAALATHLAEAAEDSEASAIEVAGVF